MKTETVMYTRFERFWHWTQAAVIVLLAVTGFEVHGSVHLLGFRAAVHLHNALGWSLLILTAFAVFWHCTTGEWRQYVPSGRGLGDMLRFYTRGIFQGGPHPVERSRERKLNPLQRLAYFTLKTVLFPLQLATGLLYLFYNSWPQWGLAGRIDAVALIHTAGAFGFLVFLVLHVYLTTTGETLFSNIRAMITGRERIPERVIAASGGGRPSDP